VDIIGVSNYAVFVFGSKPSRGRSRDWQNRRGSGKAEESSMTVSDPIADMLTRIRNALMAGHTTVSVPQAKIKVAIADILQQEGYIKGYKLSDASGASQRMMQIQLKYVGERRERRPVIGGLKRVSKPGRRVYVGKREIPWVKSGIGVSILSTPKGVMTGVHARKLGVGGEVLCEIW
jgi:small subunit ribosomal protein S8